MPSGNDPSNDPNQQERLFHESLSRYVSALDEIARRASDAGRELVSTYARQIESIQGCEVGDGEAASSGESRNAFERAFLEYSRKVDAFYGQQQVELRRIFADLAAAGEAAPAAEPTSVPGGLSHLWAMVDVMWSESQATVRQLRAELQMFQRRLEAAEALASTDPLTGLANRREAERIIGEMAQSGRRFSIMLFDLDRFKTVNDRYGHGAGDQLLRVFARRLLEQFRLEDLVCRWGGDEFLAVLSSESGDARVRTRQIADRLGGRYTVKCAGRELVIDVGVSAGAAEYAPGEVAEELFARADALLYKCKGEECAS